MRPAVPGETPGRARLSSFCAPGSSAIIYPLGLNKEEVTLRKSKQDKAERAPEMGGTIVCRLQAVRSLRESQGARNGVGRSGGLWRVCDRWGEDREGSGEREEVRGRRGSWR